MQKAGIGSHTKPNQGDTNVWLTPQWLIEALGPFDLDPCAAPSPRPWGTARFYYELPYDGLALPWNGMWCVRCGAVKAVMTQRHDYVEGRASSYSCSLCASVASIQPYRCWVNPPYGKEVDAWMDKLSQHKHGLALILARTETATWHTYIWPRAHAIFFFEGRLWFHRPDGTRGDSNAGGPSALISYSYSDTCSIARAREDGKIKGSLVREWDGRKWPEL